MAMTLLHQNASREARNCFEKYIFSLWLISAALSHFKDALIIPPSLFNWVGPLKLLPESSKEFVLQSDFLMGLKFAIIGFVVLFLLNLFKKSFCACRVCIDHV